MTDVQSALARRLLIIDFGYTDEHVAWHEAQDTKLWSDWWVKAGALMDSPEWTSRPSARRAVMSREEYEATALVEPDQAERDQVREALGVDALQKRIKREQRKSAAANTENAALRAEARKLRFHKTLLQKQLERRDEVNGGYIQRYDRIMETFGMIRALLDTTTMNGLPVPVSTTLEPERTEEDGR